ncbi:MAG: hypothetical protein QF773_01130 [Lentisphaeria bacterium]|nr:hypothetical protein [Lentisphaeria bacterium]
MKVNHLVFLIHPTCYQNVDSEAVRRNNYALFLDRELEVKQRWLEAVRGQNAGTLLMQLYGPLELFAAIQEPLGEPNACYVKAEYTEGLEQAEYHRRLVACIYEHVEKYDLIIDPGTVSSELWGESFEGCAPGYGGAFAQALGLKRPPQMKFEMTVYDSRFLYGARRWEPVPLAGSDIEAWLFECHDGSSAAIYQARLSAQWLDHRPIRLQLDPSRILVCNKRGHTAWPSQPWEKRDSEELQPYTLTTADSLWLRTVSMKFDEFRELISTATVEDAQE